MTRIVAPMVVVGGPAQIASRSGCRSIVTRCPGAVGGLTRPLAGTQSRMTSAHPVMYFPSLRRRQRASSDASPLRWEELHSVSCIALTQKPNHGRRRLSCVACRHITGAPPIPRFQTSQAGHAHGQGRDTPKTSMNSNSKSLIHPESTLNPQ